MKNLTWEGNEWQGLLFVYACFLMLLGWLAKLRSRFHPKKFLIKCWCACLRLVLRSAWNDFGLRSQLLFSWFKCRPTDARTTTRTVHPLALPTITSSLLAQLGLLNQKVEVIWISDQGLHLVDKSQRDRGGGVWQWQSSIPWHLQLVGRKYALYLSIFLPMHQGSIIFYKLIT